MITTTANVAIARDVLRRRRQLCGETQESLAEKANVTSGYISHIEIGRRTLVSPPVFVRICEALGLMSATEREQLIRTDDDTDGDA
ncbi:helix-turn-helix transcriptional regulator [Kutzneria buriramensis]|uniref:Helix-turn-helix protein n=1 Tax=Kutzneria buriramensis TaxID=1045776 RepID=A0A3E0HEG9_9PSEU|nr:helix-turn-helix transcriptional regulator [Kutzneria buriramensis]REH43608.1 helix-turn-helix protein [Kutzneria buriramensis]